MKIEIIHLFSFLLTINLFIFGLVFKEIREIRKDIRYIYTHFKDKKD